ncbi:molybdopterin synthase subunit MoaE /molybdopterin synthase subunit MoaD [Bryocella elongata]|uniref:Molybdopterin synthase catalytic subunit n=1 Tax=Bryocella elongata TaxID=863522 RepID=A0A1H5Z7W2_9BACT|nr:molybdenum cofactor biosynthesis protein MoaE [Bryocella elongata]SEG32441.1 molybdopterin synthase subunit MoaE /molybdopterin synthase subunit MoaD [Bryocella elongata]
MLFIVRSTTIHVRLLSFGPLRSSLPEGGAVCELPAGARVSELLETLTADGTLTARMLTSAAIAVNQEYAKRDHALSDGDEVAILPPVSGGLDEAEVQAEVKAPKIFLTHDVIDAKAVSEGLVAGSDGAAVIFDGVVRDNTRGRKTLYLDYEAYPEMALKQMHLLREEAIEHYGARDVAIAHRLGRIEIGESSVIIAVVSPHRAQAFAACRFVIDTLKKTVPIWKREQFADGAVWADGEPFPEEIAGAS